MVHKSPAGYTIEIETSLHPANDYVGLVNDIITTLENQTGATPNYYLLELLRNMMPTFEQAKVMLDGN